MFSLEKHPRLAHIDTGTAIALVMALVAMFGAIAALRAGNAEEDTDVLESKLSQRHLIELNLRKEYNEREGQLFHFDDDYGSLGAGGRRLRTEADALRNVDPAGAARRDVQSEVEFNAARILKPYRNATWIEGVDDKKFNTAQTIDKNVARELQSIGFGSQWKEPGESKKEETSLWLKLQEEIAAIQSRLILLTKAVVLFVAALGCLTFAELWRHNRRRMMLMLDLGLAVAASGVVLAIWADLISGIYFAAVFLLFILFGFVGAVVAPYISGFAERVALRMGFLSPQELKEKCEVDAEEKKEEEEDAEVPHPGEVEPRLFAGVRLHAEPTKRAFSVLVILFIVFTVLLSAIIGTAYSLASTKASKIGSGASDRLVEGYRNSSTSLAYSFLSKLATTQQ